MIRRVERAFLVVAIVGGLAAGQVGHAGAGQPVGAAGLTILASDADGVTLELRTTEPALQTLAGPSAGACYEATGLEPVPLAQTGSPTLPGRGVLLAVPGPDISLRVLDAIGQALVLHPMCPRTVYACAEGSTSLPCEPQLAEEPAASVDGLSPGPPAEIGAIGVARGQTVAQVLFHPLQIDAARRQWLYYPLLRVRVTWARGTQTLRAARMAGGPYDAALQAALSNDLPLAEEPTAPSRATGENRQVASWPAPPLKVYVEQDGLVQITSGAMAAAGWDLAQVDPGTLKLLYLGRERPILVEGEDDGHLNPGDAIVFYGEANTGPYSRRNVYWLSAGGMPGLRMQTRDVTPSHGYPVPAWFPASLHAEGFANPSGYWQNPPGKELQDHWYWTGRLSAPASVALPFRVPPFQLGGSATLRMLLAGATDDPAVPDHHTQLEINGTPVSEAWWDGAVQFEQITSFPLSLLSPGNNTLTLSTLADTSATVNRLYANWLELDYPALYISSGAPFAFGAPDEGDYQFQIGGFDRPDVEAYDVTEPSAPVRLMGVQSRLESGSYTALLEDHAAPAARYLALTRAQRALPAGLEADAPSDLRDPGHGADEIIITGDAFYDDVLPLATHRREQGLRVETVRIGDVYDEFSGGMVTPQAIRDFLAYAYASWSAPAPSYVLLVGDAHLDWLDQFGTGRPIYLPTHIFDAAAVGETGDDTWFAEVDGADPLPDLFLGRLSAGSSADVQAMVNKIIAYETPSAPEPWTQRALFVADDDQAVFENASESWVGKLPTDWQTKRVYAAYYPPGDPQADILEALEGGVSIISYIGHGNTDRWGSWSGGWLLDTSTAGRLANGARQPFVATATCLNGFFVNPFPGSEYSLAEELARKADGGAIAVWSPTALGYPVEQQLLFGQMFDALFASPTPTLGSATTAAKLAAYGEGVSQELVETYTLFGDPALRVPPAVGHDFYLPLLVRGVTGP